MLTDTKTNVNFLRDDQKRASKLISKILKYGFRKYYQNMSYLVSNTSIISPLENGCFNLYFYIADNPIYCAPYKSIVLLPE